MRLPALPALLLLATALPALADPPDLRPPAPFAVVLIDDRTEAALGPFPYDRAVLARGLDALAAANARAVVLKFFIDRPKSKAGDAALAASLKKIKVLLQARLDNDEPNPNPLPQRFILKTVGQEHPDAKPLSANSGWLPLPALADNAHDLAFLDSTPSVEQVPVVEKFKGHYVKSLYTAALELALDKPAQITPGHSLQIGDKTIDTTATCLATVKLPQADTLRPHSFLDLVNNKIPAADLKDRVVILGYDGAKMETNPTALGPVKGHRLFCYQLFSLYRDLSPEK